MRKACDLQSSKVADKGYVVRTNAEQGQYFAVHKQMDGLGYLKKSFYGLGPHSDFFLAHLYLAKGLVEAA